MQNTPVHSEFSDAEVALFLDCPRCFYLARVHGIMRPAEDAFPKLPSEAHRVKDSAKVAAMQRVLENGAPLQNPHCPFCSYRQTVRSTGIENDITA